MKALAIARVNVVRMLRDRSGLFFIFALPVVIIVVFGLAFGGGGRAAVGIVDGDGSPLSQALVAELDANGGEVEIRRFASSADLADAVERNSIDLGVSIPAGYDAAIRAGGQGRIETVGREEAITAAVRPIVSAAVGRQAALFRAARYAAATRGITFDAALADARRLQPEIGGVTVATESTGEQLIEAGMNGYVMGAQSQLVLFMFLTSMTAATQLIVSRQLGVSRRMFSTPTRAGTILIGETLGRFAVAMIQGLFIFVGTALVFGVKWGDPLAAAVVIVVFGLIGTGVAMLVGSVASNPEQASSVGVGAAMLLGAFGGAMVPPEVFPDVMRTVSHLTPHAWAIDALREISLRDGDVVAIAPQLAVLVGFAAILLAVATVRFRRVLQA